MQKILAFIMSILGFLCSLFNVPFYATGDEVDMTKFELTFSDEFDSYNMLTWSGHYQWGLISQPRRGGYWNKNLVRAEDGKLIIPVVYKENGYGGTGAGWYSAGIDTKNSFSQKYGYFECRCILPEGADVWSAFWLMNEGVYNVDGNGRDGTEIDIFESSCFGEKKSNAVSSNLHFDGYEDAHQQMGGKKFLVKGNPYQEFNTYGLEWNENEYIFYINGVESFRTSYGGVSQNPECLILSVEIAGDDGVPQQRSNGEGIESNFIVDYVRVYQYK